ncbi:hypothetical protein [Streptomyces sp. S1D4-20]|uniref:hypothetical protein n=1 Tax=Streptomyces sp. S1D4-20 TaxID=2594462 RepID=UPI00116538B5|nr:hypothetical protein [Streptomyces sp. S1D4-20]QDN54180.1 hypothetical protein FNV67_01005 [Streptomyces sp. S1D4-20]
MVDWPAIGLVEPRAALAGPSPELYLAHRLRQHEPAQAEQCASRMPARHSALPDAMNALAHANATLRAEIADEKITALVGRAVGRSPPRSAAERPT